MKAVRNAALLAVAFTVTLALAGCGGSKPPTYPQDVSITLAPAITSIAANATQQFIASVSNYNGSPTYTLQDGRGVGYVPLGAISHTGLYTAPVAPPIYYAYGETVAQGKVTIVAGINYPTPSSIFGTDVYTSQTFLITAPSVTAGIVPAAISVPLGSTVKFQAYAVGNLNGAYTLQVNGVTGGSASFGTIVSNATYAALYTAPTIMPMTGNTVTITVISQADPTKTANAVVTLQ